MPFRGDIFGKIFVSPDSGLHWIDECLGLCDSSSLGYQKCQVHQSGGEWLDSCNHRLRWICFHRSGNPLETIIADSCVLEYCPQMHNEYEIITLKLMHGDNADISGQIDWSRDGGKTWANAVPGCPQCSMPIINCLYFDSISVLAGLYGGYGSAIGYHSNIIMSIDSVGPGG